MELQTKFETAVAGVIKGLLMAVRAVVCLCGVLVADLCALGATLGRGPPALAPLSGLSRGGNGSATVSSRLPFRSWRCARRRCGVWSDLVAAGSG
jgi:hypothetical protein